MESRSGWEITEDEERGSVVSLPDNVVVLLDGAVKHFADQSVSVRAGGEIRRVACRLSRWASGKARV